MALSRTWSIKVTLIIILFSQISNSRKSFIFSKLQDEENIEIFEKVNNNGNCIIKKKIDIDTIRLKLKLKIYNDIYEVVDDVLKMIKTASETLNSSKYLFIILIYYMLGLKKFCKMMEDKIKKIFQRLKDENKV